MSATFDAIVIGSGFGGAISACRLAEKGMKVLVLERGRRWSAQDYPRRPGDAWLFNHLAPAQLNGWLDLRFFRHIAVSQAAGVGGGSLAYSSVALEANPNLFQNGWPSEITYSELKPYYDKVAKVMSLQTVPDGQLTQRFKLTREAAEKTALGDRFSKVPLAVTFSPEWNYQLEDPFNPRHSKTFTNAQGQQQGTCIHLGNCDIGCEVRAKNTLDLNYIPLAEQRGADVRPLHMVRTIGRSNGGYKVVFDRVERGRLVRGSESATRVLVAAGSLGSTELLLRCRDEHRTLPGLSRLLGRHWSANANVLSTAIYKDAERVQQTLGPSISGGLDFTDGSRDGERFVIEDDGFPNVVLNSLRACLDAPGAAGFGRGLLQEIEEHVRADSNLRNVMVWLGAGMDASDGQLTLKRRLFTPWVRDLDLQWTPQNSRGVIEAIAAVHRTLTDATGGRMRQGPPDSVFKNMVTLHPLGGCRMGTTAESGVVDHLGQVFGFPGLYVVDGAIAPTATGRNPSHTIAAMAERIAAHVGSSG
jgi:cholesterol oxidase